MQCVHNAIANPIVQCQWRVLPTVTDFFHTISRTTRGRVTSHGHQDQRQRCEAATRTPDSVTVSDTTRHVPPSSSMSAGPSSPDSARYMDRYMYGTSVTSAHVKCGRTDRYRSHNTTSHSISHSSTSSSTADVQLPRNGREAEAAAMHSHSHAAHP